MQIHWESTRTDCRIDKKIYHGWVKLVIITLTTQKYSRNSLLVTERTVELTDSDIQR